MVDIYAKILIFSCSGGYKKPQICLKWCDFEAAEQIESDFYFRKKISYFLVKIIVLTGFFLKYFFFKIYFYNFLIKIPKSMPTLYIMLHR